MDLKKGLSFVAFGFLFTLVNLNLTLSNVTINIMPDFIGWILLFLAFDKLGTYLESKKHLKWMSLVLIILTGTLWVLEIVMPELNKDILTTAGTVISLVYMYILFGALEQIAGDYKSSRQSTIRVLRVINLILYVLFVVTGIGYITVGHASLAAVAAVLGVAALVSAIVTLVVLFRLRKEISLKLAEE